MDPPVRGIFIKRQLALFTSHRPEVIQTVSGRRGYGMIAIRQQHSVAVYHLMCDGLTIICVDRLVTKSLRRIDAEVINLFKFRFAVAAVVFVRRKAAPMTRRIEGLS